MTSPEAGERPLLIVGASHSAVYVAAELRAKGYSGRIVMVGEEAELPYHRPHLSKESLGGTTPPPAFLKPEVFYADHRIECRTGMRVETIDRQRRQVVLSSGEHIGYDRLILATGAEPRALPSTVKGAASALVLRNKADWSVLADRLREARSLAIIGGGLIGLEVAAAARAAGLDVTVVEAGSRLMARSLYPALSEKVLARHLQSGITILLNQAVQSIKDRLVRLSDGKVVNADLVLASVGSKPRDALLRDAGLPTHDGVVVDSMGQTSDPHILAVGDCAKWPDGEGSSIRHESVAAAQWQARCLASGMLGLPAPENEPIRLWSTQGSMKLQMAGPVLADARVTLEQIGEGVVLSAFRQGVLVAVQALDAPRQFNAAVRSIGSMKETTTAAVVN